MSKVRNLALVIALLLTSAIPARAQAVAIYVLNAADYCSSGVGCYYNDNQYTTGITYLAHPATIYTAKNTFSWTEIDAVESYAQARGLQWALGVAFGANTPGWIYTDCTNSSTPCEFNSCDGVTHAPIPWVAEYQLDVKALADAIKSRYTAYPPARVVMTGVNGNYPGTSLTVSVAGTPNWQKSHSYALNKTIYDSNGNTETATTAGVSGGGTQPTWPTTLNATTNDGTVVWTLTGTCGNADDNHTWIDTNGYTETQMKSAVSTILGYWTADFAHVAIGPEVTPTSWPYYSGNSAGVPTAATQAQDVFNLAGAACSGGNITAEADANTATFLPSQPAATRVTYPCLHVGYQFAHALGINAVNQGIALLGSAAPVDFMEVYASDIPDVWVGGPLS